MHGTHLVADTDTIGNSDASLQCEWVLKEDKKGSQAGFCSYWFFTTLCMYKSLPNLVTDITFFLTPSVWLANFSNTGVRNLFNMLSNCSSVSADPILRNTLSNKTSMKIFYNINNVATNGWIITYSQFPPYLPRRKFGLEIINVVAV